MPFLIGKKTSTESSQGAVNKQQFSFGFVRSELTARYLDLVEAFPSIGQWKGATVLCECDAPHFWKSTTCKQTICCLYPHGDSDRKE